MIKYNKTIAICDHCQYEEDAIKDLSISFVCDGIYDGQQFNNFACPTSWLKIKDKHFCPSCYSKIEIVIDDFLKNKNKQDEK